MKTPKRILVISPYSGNVPRNLSYLQHAPFAPHHVYPIFLDDTDEDQRELGLHMGLAWGECAEEIWIFTDLGESAGMSYEMGYYSMNFTDIPQETLKLLDGVSCES